ncbi:MAG: Plug domain-containing protein, partial [Balneolales bacterium]|nr:Plug domain-containing protein [Balneolales bacterium]
DIPVQGSERFEIKANAESGSQNVSIRLNDQFGYLPASTEVISQLVSTPEKVQMHEQQPEIQEPVPQEAIAERAEAASADAELFINVQMQGELEEITVTSDRIGVSEVGVQEDFATQIGRNVSGMGTHFDFDEQKELENYSIQDVLTRIPGVTLIRTPLGGLTFEINTNTISINADDPPPIIMLNGVQTEINTILSLIPEEIKSISVLRSAVDLAIFGAEGSGGALIVTTRDGTHSVESKGYLNGILLGYQLPATFYSPRYGVDVPTDLEKRDNRITLHWEPEFRVSARGVELPFWGNDVPGTYRLVLEGITETGTPFFHTDTFELIEQ